MSLLHEHLDALAASIDDGATAERLLTQVGPMIGRVRRRRAARRTVTGVAAVGLVGAVAVGGTRPLGGPVLAPPASAGLDTEVWGCGAEPAAGEVADAGALAIGGVVVAVVGEVLDESALDLAPVEVAIGAAGAVTLDGTASVLVVSDGIVLAGPVTGTQPDAGADGMTGVDAPAFALPLVSCGPAAAPLPAGTYTLVVTQRGDAAGTTVELRAEQTLTVVADEQAERAERARLAASATAAGEAATQAEMARLTAQLASVRAAVEAGTEVGTGTEAGGRLLFSSYAPGQLDAVVDVPGGPQPGVTERLEAAAGVTVLSADEVSWTVATREGRVEVSLGEATRTGVLVRYEIRVEG